MSREILFKAKRANWRELPKEEWWVEGSLITGVFLRGGQDIPYILCPEKADYDCLEDFSEENGIFEVDPETVCQYTGLTDGSGRKVFENDIANVVFLEAREGALVKTYQYKVEFDQEEASYELTGNDDLLGRPCFVSANQTVMEVIGNVFDSLKLLKDGQQSESPITYKEESE